MEMTNYQAIYVRCVGACWCDICKVGKLAFITVSHMHSTIQHDVFTPCKKNKKTNLSFHYLEVQPNKISIKIKQICYSIIQ